MFTWFQVNFTWKTKKKKLKKGKKKKKKKNSFGEGLIFSIFPQWLEMKFLTQFQLLTTLKKKGLENTVGKDRENAGNQHFLFFPSVFSTLSRREIIIWIYFVVCKMLLLWTTLKFCCLVNSNRSSSLKPFTSFWHTINVLWIDLYQSPFKKF